MKKLYEEPKLDIIRLTLSDVLTPSQETVIPTGPDIGVDFDDDEITPNIIADF